MKKAKILKTATTGGKKVLSELNPIQALKEIMTSYVEWKRICETEETKRTQIESEATVDLAEIKAKEEIFLNYIEKSFKERRENFAELFQLADKAIEDQNLDALALALNSINELVKTSPLKELVDIKSVMANLNDPSHKFEV